LRSTRTSGVDGRTSAGRGLTFAGPSSSNIEPSTREVSRRMGKIRRSGTTAELELRRALHARGLRYRVDRPLLADKRRRADIVFGPARVAVFVDGCFWHGCPQHASWPANNADFWREKIETNRRRDADTNIRLEATGWQVVRVWAHEDPLVAADRIEALVRRSRSART
jgi:DNA mismatch endonuclease (patch repair protein)